MLRENVELLLEIYERWGRGGFRTHALYDMDEADARARTKRQ